LFGKDAAQFGQNPLTTTDGNGKTYRDARAELIERGFEFTRWTIEEIRKIFPDFKNERGEPYVEEAIKTFDDGRPAVRVRMFYGQTDIESKNHEAFQYFLRDSIWRASILIYDGHSSLGKTSDLEKIKQDRGDGFRFRFDSDRYQIFFFNSCSSYSYYNAQFFLRKWKAMGKEGKPEKNLDLVANGISTEFGHKADIAMVDAVLKALEGPGPSWNQIIKTVDNNNLAMIIGADDNPTQATTAKIQRRSCSRVLAQ
jgi:hypothetical protein